MSEQEFEKIKSTALQINKLLQGSELTTIEAMTAVIFLGEIMLSSVPSEVSISMRAMCQLMAKPDLGEDNGN